jgi:hypothetical protein
VDRIAHAHVPAGTLADLHSGIPVTVTRDYTHAHFPAMELDLTEARRLMRDILPGLCRDMAAAAEEEIAEAEELAAEATAPPCNCVISGGDVLPASCAGPHGIPCESCGGVESCMDDCGEVAR